MAIRRVVFFYRKGLYANPFYQWTSLILFGRHLFSAPNLSGRHQDIRCQEIRLTVSKKSCLRNYPSSHNHGKGVPPILVSFHFGSFSTSMIMGERVSCEFASPPPPKKKKNTPTWLPDLLFLFPNSIGLEDTQKHLPAAFPPQKKTHQKKTLLPLVTLPFAVPSRLAIVLPPGSRQCDITVIAGSWWRKSLIHLRWVVDPTICRGFKNPKRCRTCKISSINSMSMLVLFEGLITSVTGKHLPEWGDFIHTDFRVWWAVSMIPFQKLRQSSKSNSNESP